MVHKGIVFQYELSWKQNGIEHAVWSDDYLGLVILFEHLFDIGCKPILSERTYKVETKRR